MILDVLLCTLALTRDHHARERRQSVPQLLFDGPRLRAPPTPGVDVDPAHATREDEQKAKINLQHLGAGLQALCDDFLMAAAAVAAAAAATAAGVTECVPCVNTYASQRQNG